MDARKLAESLKEKMKWDSAVLQGREAIVTPKKAPRMSHNTTQMEPQFILQAQNTDLID